MKNTLVENRATIVSVFVLIIATSFIVWIVSILTALEDKTLGTVIAAATALAGVLYTQWQAKSREIAEGHREKKVELYNLYFDIVESFMAQAKSSDEEPGEEPGEELELTKEMEKQFTELNRGLIIWASPKVLKAWSTFRENATSNKNTLLYVDDVLQAIRKDLGNSNFGLQRGDALKVMLSNPKELDEVIASEKH